MRLPADDGVVRQEAPGDPDGVQPHPGQDGPGPDDVPGSRDTPDNRDTPDRRDTPDGSDVIEGPIGAARLKSPDQVEDEGAGADLSKLPRA